MKIRPVGAELFHANGRRDERTDMIKLIVAFHKFCERALNSWIENRIQWVWLAAEYGVLTPVDRIMVTVLWVRSLITIASYASS
jgi:hypothetical protein